jgi:hypothetical protein
MSAAKGGTSMHGAIRILNARGELVRIITMAEAVAATDARDAQKPRGYRRARALADAAVAEARAAGRGREREASR